LHQPIEDAFQEKLLSRSGRAYGLLKPLLNDDRLQFVEHSDRFIETLEGVLRGNVIPRDVAVGYGERAITELYRQIVFEERAVFPYAIELLDADDWLTLNRDILDWQEATPIANNLQKDYRQLISRLDVPVH
jgi:hemerythrin-like domain-containing protein